MSPIAPPPSCKVYTPEPLAAGMVTAVYEHDQQRWLEPSFGQGVFLKVLAERGIARKKIISVDLDNTPSPNDRYSDFLRGVDFLAWSSKERQRLDCIVGNPPFVAIHSLPKQLQVNAAKVLDRDGKKLGIRANTWYAFLMRSINLLRSGGNLAFVLPAACEFADYCRAGRESITSQFGRVDLIRSRKSIFEGVQEGAAILICRNKGGKDRQFRRHEVNGLEQAIERLEQLSSLRAKPCPNGALHKSTSGVELSSVAQIGLGGVTGDTQYFTMSEQRRQELKLPLRAVRPVLSKARQIKIPFADKKAFDRLRDSGERIWLFDPTPKLAYENAAVRSYLRRTTHCDGYIRKRYKVRIRRPWYRTPMPKRADAFISGMSMSGVWMCFNEMERLNATNTLYVVSFKSTQDWEKRFEWALALCTTSVRKQFQRLSRVYADGLRKVEPGDVGRVLVPTPSNIKWARRTYLEAVNALIAGDEDECQRVADKAFGLK